jgi:hypothetical protein
MSMIQKQTCRIGNFESSSACCYGYMSPKSQIVGASRDSTKSYTFQCSAYESMLPYTRVLFSGYKIRRDWLWLVYLWREPPSLVKKCILTPKQEPCLIPSEPLLFKSNTPIASWRAQYKLFALSTSWVPTVAQNTQHANSLSHAVHTFMTTTSSSRWYNVVMLVQ